MILGGGRDELERGLGGERGGRAGGAVPFLEAPGRSQGWAELWAASPGVLLGCAGSSIEEAMVEGICPVCVPIFPKSAPNFPALPLTVPSPPAPTALSLGKSSQN